MAVVWLEAESAQLRFSGGKCALAWKGAKLPVNVRQIMPAVFVSSLRGLYDRARYMLEEFNSPIAQIVRYEYNYVSIWRFHVIESK